jgi:Kdo2-lipid IVA lauroyltransferase/acyltransferase
MASSDGRRRRPSTARRLRAAVACVPLFVARSVLSRLPDGLVRALAGLLGTAGYLLDRRHRAIALRNFAQEIPEVPPARRRAAIRASFRNLSTTAVETLASSRWSPDELRRRLLVEGWSHLEAAEADGHGVLLISGHLGNWELAGHLFALEGRPLTFVARPLDHPWLDREVRGLRERFGNRGVPKRGGARALLATLKAGGHAFLLVDQRVHPNEGKAFRFFTRPAYTSLLPASLSLRTGAPVVPFFGIPLGDGRWRVEIHPPIRPGEPPRPGEEELSPEDRLTLRYLEGIEREIRRRPGLWLWMHRRWRKNPTRFRKRRLPKTAAGPQSTEVIERGAASGRTGSPAPRRGSPPARAGLPAPRAARPGPAAGR